ncbi:MAG: hemerythrin domain-containing protein [Alphaproteobacteria bacterium]|nr:hemerythrin domain-containing protein [Alphaproteobacteria bacterium]
MSAPDPSLAGAPLIVWRDDFNTGIAAVDHEHRELIGLINGIHADLCVGRTSADALLGHLHDAIAAHFALEERIMRVHAYGGYAPHKEDHERLLDDIRDIMDHHAARPDQARLGARLAAWFSHHFRTLDADLHRLLGDAGG